MLHPDLKKIISDQMRTVLAPKKDNQEANPAMLNGMDPVIVNYVDAKGKPVAADCRQVTKINRRTYKGES